VAPVSLVRLGRAGLVLSAVQHGGLDVWWQARETREQGKKDRKQMKMLTLSWGTDHVEAEDTETSVAMYSIYMKCSRFFHILLRIIHSSMHENNFRCMQFLRVIQKLTHGWSFPS
jgi:hypothetical protein